jgi:hypothetical protein
LNSTFASSISLLWKVHNSLTRWTDTHHSMKSIQSIDLSTSTLCRSFSSNQSYFWVALKIIQRANDSAIVPCLIPYVYIFFSFHPDFICTRTQETVNQCPFVGINVGDRTEL